MTTDLIRHLRAATIVEIDPAEAKARWAAFRSANGRRSYQNLLTDPSENVKLAKTLGVAAVFGLSLAPAGLSGYQVCRWRTKACEAGCVAFAGKGELPSVMAGRVLRTRFLAEDPSAFVTLVAAEIDKARAKYGADLAVRLNTFSDLPWEDLAPWLFVRFAEVSFYDYTKNPDRMAPENYRLVRSCSERMTDDQVVDLVTSGQNVAVVFSPSRHQALPTVWNGLPVIDGDKSDARHLDPVGVVVGLRAKGRMRRNPMGMVRELVNA